MTPRRRPGPAAHQAFNIGAAAAGLAGLAAVALLAWWGVVTPSTATIVLTLLFPVYMVTVAIGLSRWLGYTPDWTDLRRVDPSEETGADSDGGP